MSLFDLDFFFLGTGIIIVTFCSLRVVCKETSHIVIDMSTLLYSSYTHIEGKALCIHHYKESSLVN
jgi:hypothetical protein